MLRIYRNLHQGLKFSIRENGRVIDRQEVLIARKCSFRVSPAGRERVLREKRKNVHAFVLAESYEIRESIDVRSLSTISYNPYLAAHFVCDSEPISTCTAVAFSNGRCYKLHQ